MSEAEPLFETGFVVAALLNILVMVFFGIVLYWIYGSPRVNKKLFLGALGIFAAPIVVVLAYVLVNSGDFLIFLGMIALLPFVAAYLVANVVVDIYYGAAYTSLLVAYLVARRKRARKAPVKK